MVGVTYPLEQLQASLIVKKERRQGLWPSLGPQRAHYLVFQVDLDSIVADVDDVNIEVEVWSKF